MALARKRRPDARPEEILEAALDVFVEDGFAAARMEDVAKRAGISKGAVYLYFNSKEALLEELVARSAGAIAAAAERFARTEGAKDPEAAIRALYVFLAHAMAEKRLLAAPRVVLAEAQRFPRIAAFYRREVINVAKRALETILKAGMAKGLFRKVDCDIAARAIMGPMLASMLIHHVFPDPAQPPPDPQALAEGLGDLLLNGLRPISLKDGS